MSKVKAGEAYVEIGGDPRKLFAALSKVQRQIGKVGSSMAAAGTKMAAIGTAIVGPIAGSAQAFANVGSALFDMSKRTGVATEALSVFQFAANQTGTDMAGVETAVRKMQKAIFSASNGSKEAADALAMVGLSASDLAGLSADQQMGKIADGLMAIQDDGTRAAVAMALFGKSGTAILPMLEGGSAGMAAFAADAKRLGLVMDGQTAEKADALGDAIDSLLASMQMAFLQVGSAVAPILTQLAQSMAVAAAEAGKFIANNQGLIVAALKFGAAFAAAGVAIIGIGKGLSLVSGVMGVLLNPIGATIALVTAAVAALGYFSGAFDGLAQIASTTFQGIYDAIAMGDLSGAMDVLWAGLQAGWLRGVEALMGYVDPWISMFQNAFTILGAEIYKVWDTIWVNVSNSFNTFGAVLMGAFDNVINGVMAAWDTLEAGIRKSWNYVQSFFKKGFDLEKENNKVDSEMTARARKRELERPGVEGRTRKAAEENRRELRERDDRAKAVDANTEATIAAREDQNRKNADARRAATQAAEANLAGLSRGQRESRVFRGQADDAIGRLGSASTMDEVRQISEEFHLLAETGRLTAEQQKKYAEAVEAAQERIETARGEIGVGEAAKVDPNAVKQAAADAAAAQSEVVGTFSAASIGGMGFGQSLQQKANDLLGRIEQNTRADNEGRVAA